jgi:amidophosphoribosyltransferase
MPGIFGLRAYYQDWVDSTSRFIGYGLIGLQHRGQESFGIAVSSMDGRVRTYKENTVAYEAFDEKRLKMLRGCAGIGAVTTVKERFLREIQPISEGGVWLVHDGRFLSEGGARGFARNLRRALMKADPEQAAAELVERTPGGYTFCALVKDGTIIFGRDPRGVKPLSHVGLGFDNGLISSETCAFNVVGSKYPPQFVEPGECFSVTQYSKIGAKCKTKKRSTCSFEYVYLANLLSKIDGIPISLVRRRIGERLAKKFPHKADVVLGVPETARAFAMAYSNQTGIPIAEGFSKIVGERSAIRPTQIDREIGVQLKLNPIKEAMSRKNVVVIDDSVVRGTTTRKTFRYMRDYCGVKDIHLLVGSPKIVAECPYGTEVPSEDELIARNLDEEEISQAVNADSVGFLTTRDLAECIGIPISELCMGCFTGRYPGDEE